MCKYEPSFSELDCLYMPTQWSFDGATPQIVRSTRLNIINFLIFMVLCQVIPCSSKPLFHERIHDRFFSVYAFQMFDRFNNVTAKSVEKMKKIVQPTTTRLGEDESE